MKGEGPHACVLAALSLASSLSAQEITEARQRALIKSSVAGFSA